MPFLECKNLTKSIGNRNIINDVSFTLRQGEITGLVGPNGAGKSTLMKLIVHLYLKTSGKIVVNSVDQDKNFPDFMHNIGAVIETPMFPSNLTARQALRFFYLLRVGSNKFFEKRFEDCINRVGLEKAKDKKISTFSLGMKQRLALAQVLIGSPEILLLDEPFNGLDPDGVEQLHKILLTEKDKGHVILISSHTLSELERVCDRTIFFKAGRVITTTDSIGFGKLTYKTIILRNLEDVDKTLQFISTFGHYKSKADGKKIFIENITVDRFIELVSKTKSFGIEISEINTQSQTLENEYDSIIRKGV